MKILVFTHHLEIGGSQVNAIDLANRDPRHLRPTKIVVFATPGPAAALVADRGPPAHRGAHAAGAPRRPRWAAR